MRPDVDSGESLIQDTDPGGSFDWFFEGQIIVLTVLATLALIHILGEHGPSLEVLATANAPYFLRGLVLVLMAIHCAGIVALLVHLARRFVCPARRSNRER